MIPLSDGIPARSFPFVNVALIVANFAVWIFYELPHLGTSVYHASFYPCAVQGTCHAPEPWGVSWFTAMFLHGSWDHILGNMLFLAIFGKNVEDSFGHVRYLALYIAGGFVAASTQTLMTLIGGSVADAAVPVLGASGAIAAVLGAYFVLYPDSRILTLVLVFPVRIYAWVFLGLWFLYQLVEANFGLFSAGANGGVTAFFAHVGGFAFGFIVVRLLAGSGLLAGTARAPTAVSAGASQPGHRSRGRLSPEPNFRPRELWPEPAHSPGATGRSARRRGRVQRRHRGSAVHQPAHRRLSPPQGVLQAGGDQATPACRCAR